MTGSMAIDPSVLDSETMTLTARQFEAVRTRVNTLTATMRRRMEQAATRKDIREVFTSGPLSPPVVSCILYMVRIIFLPSKYFVFLTIYVVTWCNLAIHACYKNS